MSHQTLPTCLVTGVGMRLCNRSRIIWWISLAHYRTAAVTARNMEMLSHSAINNGQRQASATRGVSLHILLSPTWLIYIMI